MGIPAVALSHEGELYHLSLKNLRNHLEQHNCKECEEHYWVLIEAADAWHRKTAGCLCMPDHGAYETTNPDCPVHGKPLGVDTERAVGPGSPEPEPDPEPEPEEEDPLAIFGRK